MIPADTPEIDITQFAQAARAGFDAYSVAGGTSKWARSGRSVVSGSATAA